MSKAARRRVKLVGRRCPHCLAPLEKAWWACFPEKHAPDFVCPACAGEARFPTGTRLLAAVISMLPLAVGIKLTLAIPDIEGLHPLLMVGAMLLAFAATGIAFMLVGAWICSTSIHLDKWQSR